MMIFKEIIESATIVFRNLATVQNFTQNKKASGDRSANVLLSAVTP
jgi:hypothetical protein